MSDILDFYKSYEANGGMYRLENYKGSSRALMLVTWLRQHLTPGARVLDIGCGDGAYSRWMPEFEWTGIDINDELGRTDYNGTRLVRDLESSPYDLETGSFDAVICSEVLEHLFSPEKVHAEAARLLKPRGIYIITTPNFDWIEHHLCNFGQVVYNMVESHTKEHIRFYTLDSHYKLLDKAGFTPVDFTGADAQYGSFFHHAVQYMRENVLKEAHLGEVHYHLGRMFPTVSHTIGVLSVKR